MKKLSVLMIVFVVFIVTIACNDKSGDDSKETSNDKDKLSVFVSILPQKYFLQRIGGDKIDVSVMVKPGSSPATYEPKPSQMMKLEDADAYVSIGVPFEKSWLSKIESANPDMLIIRSDKDIEKRQLPSKHHHNGHSEEEHEKEVGSPDPHIWLSPRLVKVQCDTITKALSTLDSQNSEFYKSNYKNFVEDIDKLDKEIKSIINKKSIDHFMVFHPAWGYFADNYGLEQIAVEVEGKEPSPKELAQFIDIAREEDIRVIFVQPQFSKDSAKTIAQSINGEVIPIDPLAENWLDNLKEVANTFGKVLSSE